MTSCFSDESDESYFTELPCQYQDERFRTALSSYKRHNTDFYLEAELELNIIATAAAKTCSSEDEAYKDALLFADYSLFFLLEDRDKVALLQKHAMTMSLRNPTQFRRGILGWVWNYLALLPEHCDAGMSMEEAVGVKAEGKPNLSKFYYLMAIANLYAIQPIVSFRDIELDEDHIRKLLEYCIDIDLAQLDRELLKGCYRC